MLTRIIFLTLICAELKCRMMGIVILMGINAGIMPES